MIKRKQTNKWELTQKGENFAILAYKNDLVLEHKMHVFLQWYWYYKYDKWQTFSLKKRKSKSTIICKNQMLCSKERENC